MSRHVVDQGGGGYCAATGEGDGQYTAGIGEGGEGVVIELQVVAADGEQRVRGIEAEDIAGNRGAGALQGEAGARPVTVATVEGVELGIRQYGIGTVIQHHDIADARPGDAAITDVDDARRGIGGRGGEVEEVHVGGLALKRARVDETYGEGRDVQQICADGDGLVGLVADQVAGDLGRIVAGGIDLELKVVAVVERAYRNAVEIERSAGNTGDGELDGCRTKRTGIDVQINAITLALQVAGGLIVRIAPIVGVIVQPALVQRHGGQQAVIAGRRILPERSGLQASHLRLK
ncbi:hypothetical protein D9M70_187780 [compost metagenome]